MLIRADTLSTGPYGVQNPFLPRQHSTGSLADETEMPSVIGMLGRSWAMYCGFNRSGESLYRDIQIGVFLGCENNPNSRVCKSILANGEAALETTGHDSDCLCFSDMHVIREHRGS